jgi:uncharacterized protein (DUF1015 family)
VVEVAPFRALEYNPDKADLARVVSPPFDVISPEALARLRAASPHNIVHVTLNAGTFNGATMDPYEAADKVLEAWLTEGILRATDRDLVYAYECAYEHKGVPRRMRGVLARLRLDPTYTQVLPHEEIFPKPTEERMKLLRATATDVEPIHLLYSGKGTEQALWAYVDGSQRPPDLTLAGLDGAVHRYWRVVDEAVIGTVVEGFKGRRAYIADGHHRYNAAVRYAEERRVREYRPPKNAPCEYKFALLVNLADPGLLILPTHRLVKHAPTLDAKKVVPRWEEHFTVHTVALPAGSPVAYLQDAIDAHPGHHVVGAWLGDPKRGYLLEAKDAVVPEQLLPGRSHTYRSLDVVYLQRLALERGLQVPEDRWGDDVTYTRSDQDAEAAVKEKKARAVLLHRATKLNQFRAIAEGGEKMPQKSTYFLPKTLSGVALYRIGKPGPVTKPRITS